MNPATTEERRLVIETGKLRSIIVHTGELRGTFSLDIRTYMPGPTIVETEYDVIVFVYIYDSWKIMDVSDLVAWCRPRLNVFVDVVRNLDRDGHVDELRFKVQE